MDYTDLYEFQTRTGIVVPSDADVLAGIQTKFQEIFGTDIDLSPETPVGRLIEAFAVLVKTTLGVTAQNANQFNLNEATGIYLDAIAQMYNLTRIPSTKTRITIKCYFSDNGAMLGLTIPTGSLVMCSANGAFFRTDAPIVNEGMVEEETGRIYAIGTATAVEAGEIVAPTGTVNSIQSGIMGWIGVTNIGLDYTGTNLETDEAFRERIINSRPIGIGFSTHLSSALNRLDGVYSNCIVENNYDKEMVSKGVTLPPHSVFVGVDCVGTTSLYRLIAEEIMRAKSVGASMVSTDISGVLKVEQEVGTGYDDQFKTTVTFYVAKRTAINVQVQYFYDSYAGDSIGEDITKEIQAYVSTVGTGGQVVASRIASRLIENLGVGIAAVWLQKAGSGEAVDSIVEMNAYETPYVLSGNITLNEGK